MEPSDAGRSSAKRALPWMPITLCALAGFIAWRMASLGRDGKNADPAHTIQFQPNSVVTVQQQSYACNSLELLERSVAFKLADANDKLRALVSRHECELVLPQQPLKIASLKGTRALVETSLQAPPRWMAIHDLVPVENAAP